MSQFYKTKFCSKVFLYSIKSIICRSLFIYSARDVKIMKKIKEKFLYVERHYCIKMYAIME